MNTTEQAAKAEAFRALHRGPRLLLMANAWDAVTARLFEAEGFAAVATTSGGVSWTLGYADGEAAPWDEVVEQTARIARAVAVPVTADIEGGFGATPEAVGRSITDIIGAGAVGVNLEDSVKGSLEVAGEVCPAVNGCGLARSWAGLEAFTPDELPVIGPVPGVEGVIVAAGFSGHGFALSPVVGDVLARLALGRDALLPLWSDLRLDRPSLAGS